MTGEFFVDIRCGACGVIYEHKKGDDLVVECGECGEEIEWIVDAIREQKFH